ncbi:MAG: TlpA family protein disulfide reductase [Acidimicrobiales bacterium]
MSPPDPGRSPWDPDPRQPPWAVRRLQALSHRTRTLLAAVTVGVIVVAGVVDGMTRTPEPVQHLSDEGPAPALRLPSVKDPSVTVSLRADAGHPVILNFWGSWCGPCQEEMPLLAKTAKEIGSAGRIRFLGVDLEDVHRSAAVAMMDRYGTPYPSGYDPNDSVTSEFKVVGTPTTIFIDSQGHIVGRYVGALSATVLQFWIQHLT